MGGGVQFYFQQNRDLSLKPWLAKSLSEIATFCRARQPYVHRSKAIPQIALLYPTASVEKNGVHPFSNTTGMLQGALNLVLDGQNSVEILMEHHLKGKMNRYPLIIVPECDFLEASFIEELKQYVANGGNLLVIGTETAKIFEKELGINSLVMGVEEQGFIAASDKIGAIRSTIAVVGLSPDAKVLSTFYNSSDFRDKGKNVAASVCKFGKGKIEAVYFNAGSAYLEYKSPVLRDFISDRITELFPEPFVKVMGSHLLHVTVNQINEKLFVNLVNIAGEHTNQNAIGYDEIPSLKNLMISIKTEKKPAKIILQPDGRELQFEYSDGISKVVVPELLIHSILEIK